MGCRHETQMSYKSKVICTRWEKDIRKWFRKWKVEAYLTIPPEKVNLPNVPTEYIARTLVDKWKRTKLEYYQEQINPSCWSTYMDMDASAQTYTSISIPLLYHRNVARFRTRSHTFTLEKGDWLNLPQHAKVCRFCDSQIVKTEAHVALQCPRYAHISKRPTSKYWRTPLSSHQFSLLPLQQRWNLLLPVSFYIVKNLEILDPSTSKEILVLIIRVPRGR